MNVVHTTCSLGKAIVHSLTCERPGCPTLRLPDGQTSAVCKCGKSITHGTINMAVPGARSV